MAPEREHPGRALKHPALYPGYLWSFSCGSGSWGTPIVTMIELGSVGGL